MFNGIIYNTGIVKRVLYSKNSLEIILKTKLSFNRSEVGSSLSCNGTCLTITKINKNLISFYLSKETLKKTSFKFIKVGSILNIEKSLSYGNKISGHYVQGHIDTSGKVSKINIVDKTWIVSIIIEKAFKKYLIDKGSISINDVSLTISKVKKNISKIRITNSSGTLIMHHALLWLILQPCCVQKVLHHHAIK